MKWLIWSTFAVVAALWTGAAWAIVAVLDGIATMTATSQPVDIAAWLAGLHLPAWASYWLEVHAEGLRAASAALAALLKTLGAVGPALASALWWLGVAVWLCWGLGFLVVLGLAWGLHVLVGRATAPAPAGTTPAG